MGTVGLILQKVVIQSLTYALQQRLGGLLDKAIYAVAVDSPESAAAVGASAQINSTQLKRFG